MKVQQSYSYNFTISLGNWAIPSQTMEEKIITAIQHICFKSNQRVTSQIIFWFFNKSPLIIEFELFQNRMNRLEIDCHFYKKRGVKILKISFNSITPDSNKNDGPDNVQRVNLKLKQSLKTIEKLE